MTRNLKRIIKKNKTLYNTSVFFYYLFFRFKELLSEGNERREYIQKIKDIKKKKRIVVDIAFCGIGDLLVWSSIPQLLKEQLDVDFYISRSTRKLIKNHDIFKLVFIMNPFFKGVSDEVDCFRFKNFTRDSSLKEFLLDRGGLNNIEILEKQFNLNGSGLPKIYYKPNTMKNYANTVLIDKNMISGKKFGWIFKDEVFEKEGQKFGSKLEYVYKDRQDIFEYIDMMFSCKYFVCTFSGGASLAAAIGINFSVVWPLNAKNRTNYQFVYSRSKGNYFV